MNKFKVFLRGWIYHLKRNARQATAVDFKLGGLVRQKVPAFDRRRKT